MNSCKLNLGHLKSQDKFFQGLAVTLSPACGEPVSLANSLDDCIYSSKHVGSCLAENLKRCVILYESSGLYKQSYLRKVTDFEQGRPQSEIRLPDSAFAEGADVWYQSQEASNNGGNKLVVATWMEKRLFEAIDRPEVTK